MILQALTDYYEILAEEGTIPKPGYCMAKVSYALNLTQDGQLIGVLPLKIEKERGKKKVEIPQSLEVPERIKRSGNYAPNFLCDNSGFVLGVNNKGKPERSWKCFEEFRKLHHQVLDGVVCPEAKAVLAFLDSWNPEQYEKCTAIETYREELSSGANIIFSVAGVGFVQNSAKIKEAWEYHRSGSSDSIRMQCLVTGKVHPIARLHPSISGVRGAQPMGASIVSFNERAYESYGRDSQQGLNAPVSEYASFAYATVLNHLLSEERSRQFFGDATVVYWAKSPKQIYQDLFTFSLDPVNNSAMKEDLEALPNSTDKNAEGLIAAAFKKLIEGKPIDMVDGAIDPETRFYILGLAPNAARLSIRFFLENSFGQVMKNVVKHYLDLEIEKAPNDFEFLPLWKLLSETVSPKSKDKSSSPLLSGAVLNSIFAGTPYPDALYSSVLLRIRAEKDINRGKAAIIKAFQIRKNGMKYKEELAVSLNEQSENKAYVLGRLFAVLEKAQQEASPGIKSTIKDRYFTSACSTPASVFPILLRLSHHHTAKSDYGNLIEKKKGELLDKLKVDQNPFPAHQSLDDQGIFILGYYHQQKSYYTKKDKEEK